MANEENTQTVEQQESVKKAAPHTFHVKGDVFLKPIAKEDKEAQAKVKAAGARWDRNALGGKGGWYMPADKAANMAQVEEFWSKKYREQVAGQEQTEASKRTLKTHKAGDIFLKPIAKEDLESRTKIKNAGGKWDNTAKCWYMPADKTDNLNQVKDFWTAEFKKAVAMESMKQAQEMAEEQTDQVSENKSLEEQLAERFGKENVSAILKSAENRVKRQEKAQQQEEQTQTKTKSRNH